MEIEVLCPPKEDEVPRIEPVKCTSEKCGFTTEIAITRDCPGWGKPLAKCPKCSADMIADISAYRQGITARGAGFHGTAFGRRRKKEMTARNEKLKTKQWENHAPIPVSEGTKIRNPTKGGPNDPNSRFNKKTG